MDFLDKMIKKYHDKEMEPFWEAMAKFKEYIRREPEAHSEIRAYINDEEFIIPAKNPHLLEEE